MLCGLPVVSHPDSYFVWLPLGEESRADRLANALMERRISVSTAEPFCVSATIPQALRIALGSVPSTACARRCSACATPLSMNNTATHLLQLAAQDLHPGDGVGHGVESMRK